jgi:hypothetical protein
MSVPRSGALQATPHGPYPPSRYAKSPPIPPQICIEMKQPSETPSHFSFGSNDLQARNLLRACVMHDQQDRCLQICNDCAAACEHCAMACIDDPEPQAFMSCVHASLDCAAICRLVAELIARDSRFTREMYLVCAHVCEATAAECAKHSADHCQLSVETCRNCANECRRLAGRSD